MRGRVDDFTVRREAPPVRSEVNANHRVTSNASELRERIHHCGSRFGAFELGGFRCRVSIGNPRAEQGVRGEFELHSLLGIFQFMRFSDTFHSFEVAGKREIFDPAIIQILWLVLSLFVVEATELITRCLELFYLMFRIHG